MVGRVNWSRHVYPTPSEASRGLADRLVELAVEATRRAGRFTLAVSGGRTPAELYTQLGTAYATRIPWVATDLFFADERAVPPQDPRSNFALVQRTLIAPLRNSGLRVHRIEGEREPTTSAADRYEADLRATLGARPSGPPAGPTFDTILLGVGSDGHTASLFPGAAALHETERWTIVEPWPHLDPRVTRISLTLPAIRASRHALFLVCGEDKREIVQRVFDDPARGTPQASLPSACITAVDGVEWFFDVPVAPKPDDAVPR
jgi:6-phosphogluconolactonase